MKIFGVFGYQFVEELELKSFKLIPKFLEWQLNSKILSADTERSFLTGYGVVKEDLQKQELYDYQAILCFIQQQRIDFTDVIEIDDTCKESKIFDSFDNKINLAIDRKGLDYHLVKNTDECKKTRIGLIEHLFKKLNDNTFNKEKGFRDAFYRNVESFRMYKYIVDQVYFLLFSALEITTRKYHNNYSSNINLAKLMEDFLIFHGFDLKEYNVNNKKRATSTYCHLRNSLFHNGELYCDINDNGDAYRYEMSEYFIYIRKLVPDVLLKLSEYDNELIDWGRWEKDSEKTFLVKHP